MQKKQNEQFVILTAIGMILVMFGHLDCPFLSFFNFLPYYSYHVMLFVFISGYFYQSREEEHIAAYIKRKFLHLILPYLCWNLFYGIVASCIHYFHIAGVNIGGDLSLYNLLIAPFYSGHQFMFHAAAWFVPALFLMELCNILGRKSLSLLHIKNEYIITMLYFLIGFAVVYLAKRGSVYDFYKLPGRLMLMAPIFQSGHLYRVKLEAKDKLPSLPYFLILILVQALIMWYTKGSVNYSVVWVTGFANGVFMPFITALVGILFWLRIAKLLTSLFEKVHNRFLTPLKKGLDWMGTYSYAIMMHHLFGFFILNLVLFYIHRYSKLLPMFDTVTFQNDIYYNYCRSGGNPFWFLLYLISGITAALALNKLSECILQAAAKIKDSMIHKNKN